MHSYPGSDAMQRDFALAVPLCAVAWVVTAPAVLTTWNFVALLGLFVAFGWVAKAAHLNSRLTSSFAQLPHHTNGRVQHPRASR